MKYFRRPAGTARLRPRRPPRPIPRLEVKACTPEINTSEIIVDFEWHFPMDFHLCDFWCVIFCPECRAPRAASAPSYYYYYHCHYHYCYLLSLLLLLLLLLLLRINYNASALREGSVRPPPSPRSRLLRAPRDPNNSNNNNDKDNTNNNYYYSNTKSNMSIVIVIILLLIILIVIIVTIIVY